MKTEEIAARIQSELGSNWPRIKPIPVGVLAPLCEALWEEGKLPTRSVLKHDVGAEALRNPEEIGRALDEAAGKIGALTEVIGGTCVVGNMCPAKFACVGCPGNSPDPTKRQQIVNKMEWAGEQARHAAQQQLPAEQRQMEKVVADCTLMLQEMDLIDAARTDQSQLVRIEHMPRGRQ